MAIPRFLKYALVWIFPLISAFTWLGPSSSDPVVLETLSLTRALSGMLLAMLIVWEVEGHPHYTSMEANQHIAYISDIGAQGLKPLFITGCVVTTVFLDLSFASERWLRHTGRLAKNLGVAEKVLSALSSTTLLSRAPMAPTSKTLTIHHSNLRHCRNLRPHPPLHLRHPAPPPSP